MIMNPIEYSIFCDDASVSENGKLNMSGVFDKLLAEKVPAIHKQMFIVTKYLLQRGSYRVSMVLMHEDEVIAKTYFDKEIDEEVSSGSHIWEIQNLKIENFGLIELEVLINGKQLFIKTLPVIKL